MRNSKVKGFTLIELIVVIAIIGILAAILVPSMLGYVRNSRITQANANAKQVYTAVAAAITQAAIDGKTLSTENQGNQNPNPQGGGEVTYSASDNIVASTDGKTIPFHGVDLFDYLGTGYQGFGCAYINKQAYTISCAVWGSTADLLTAGKGKVENGKASVDSDGQKADCKSTGKVYGIYPLKGQIASGSGAGTQGSQGT